MHEESFDGNAVLTPDVEERNESLSTHVDEGEGFNLSDAYVPRLNICQPTSSDVEGTPGDIVIDKVYPAYKVGVKAPLFILSIKKGWKEDIEFGSSETPRFAHTQAEADALQRELKEEGSDRKVIHFADVVLLLERTDECLIDEEEAAGSFPFNVGGKDYALLKATFQKTAYDGTARRIVNVQLANKGLDLSTVPFFISTAEKKAGKNRWFTPTILPNLKERAPAELTAFINDTLRGGAR